MSTFENEARPRTGLAEAKRRERRNSKSVTKLMNKKNEEEFIAGLEDLGITSNHPKYKEILAIWREQLQRG